MVMKVTRIEELTKSRSKVYIDEEFAFVLYKGELRQYNLVPGEEILKENYETIMTQVLPKRAKLRAMNLLKNKEYTVKQLREKLLEGGYPECVAKEALDYVAGYHYTDDLRFAAAFITSHESTKSRRRIEQDLLGRGIERDTLEQAWQEWEKQGGCQDEQAMIKELLVKRGFDPRKADMKERQRQGAFLMRRGFSGEQIRKALFGGGYEDC